MKCSDCETDLALRVVWRFGEARCCGRCAVARMKKGEKVHAE